MTAAGAKFATIFFNHRMAATFGTGFTGNRGDFLRDFFDE